MALGGGAQSRLQVVVEAVDRSKQTFSSISGRMQTLRANAVKIGASLAAIGTIGILAMKNLVQSAAEQEIGIKKLDAALQTIGSSYEDIKSKLEPTIEFLQRTTNFGDEELREAFRQLVIQTGDYDTALRALPIAVDIAAGAPGNKKLERVATDLGRAIGGIGDETFDSTSLLRPYGIVVDKTATQTELLAAATEKYKGQAEAAANPVIQLMNRLGDFGQLLVEDVLPATNLLAIILERVVREITNAPAPVQNLIKFFGLLMGIAIVLAAVGGPIVLMIVAFGAMGIAVGSVALTFGIVILAIAGVITIVILMIKHWDTLTKEFEVLGVRFNIFTLALLALAPPLGVTLLIFQNWSTILGVFKAVWDGVVKGVSSGVDSMMGFFGRVKDSMIGFFGAARDTINEVKDALSDLVSAVTKFKLPKLPDIPGIPFFEHGGIAGGLAVVGERGPEIVSLPQGSRVTPSGIPSRNVAAGAGGGTTIIQLVLDGNIIAEVLGNRAENFEQVRSS
jgi:phage-related protein